ncbi:hypothetical protein XENOCAPTIV_024227 [Xenoophorus captivus]|uniref:Uncharacterized protein n=1 Tax=Xenoophorus captivus TaxID=1517983 RepID=A0ABV0QJW4_9TELE
MACKNSRGGKKEDASLTLEATTALLQQHREALTSEFKSSANVLSSKLDQVQLALEEQAERVSSLVLATEDLSQRVASLEDSCAALHEDNVKLKDKVIDLESRSRRQNIRILGRPPHPVILRLHRYLTKDLIIREAKRRGRLDYQGTSLRIVEDYRQTSWPDVRSTRPPWRSSTSGA